MCSVCSDWECIQSPTTFITAITLRVPRSIKDP